MLLKSWLLCASVSAFALACSSPGTTNGEPGSGTGGGDATGTVGGAPTGGSSSVAGLGGALASGGLGGSANTSGATGVGGAVGTAGSASAGGNGGTSGGAGSGGSSGSGSSGPPNFYAIAPNLVEVWVNGTFVGQSTSAGALLSAAASFNLGQANIIAVRASKGTAAKPSLQAEMDGVFGKAGTSTRWRTKAASSTDETTGDAWAAYNYNDNAWTAATDVNVAPTASALVTGPAHGIWTSSAADATALFRTRIYIPGNWSANKPYGFGSAVTGGQGGSVVTVTTAAQLAAAVTGNTAKIIQVSGTIDFTGSEGNVNNTCCLVGQCASGPSEYITDDLGACAGKATFSCTYDKAGTTPLAVGSNKTIIGIGPNATIKGKGFTLVNNVTNIVIRNLTITNLNPQVVWGGDAITISGATNVWVDHTRISLIGRQFIVTGFSPATNVTISYNEFDGNTPYSATCNGAHYWALLMAGSNDTITALGNWVHHTSWRGPHAGGLDTEKINMQFVNDYYMTVPGHAADADLNSNLFFEGTYFSNVTTPFTPTPKGFRYAPVASNLGSTTSACTAVLGRACIANATDSTTTTTFPLDAQALSAMAPYKGSMLLAYPAVEVPYSVPSFAGPGHI
jgi:pectate lyase